VEVDRAIQVPQRLGLRGVDLPASDLQGADPMETPRLIELKPRERFVVGRQGDLLAVVDEAFPLGDEGLLLFVIS
jgi:hypothetical protein